MDTNGNPVLIAYANAILAKDLSGRYSNPGRAMRSYQDIMSVANTGQDMLAQFMNMYNQQQQQAGLPAQNPVVQPNGNVLHTQPAAPVPPAPPAPPVQQGISHKELSQRLESFKKGMLGDIEKMFSKTLAPVEVATE